jgi:hypothetical protein
LHTFVDEKQVVHTETAHKVQVFVFAECREDMHAGKLISPPEKRLCLPTDLKIIGFAD